MHYEIVDDNLAIFVTPDEKASLLESWENDPSFNSDAFMYEWFEDLIANSELQWLSAEQTGDLTDAPILGIWDDSENVLERWAFMGHQVTSPQLELANQGVVMFIK